jgi:hypothetical protein
MARRHRSRLSPTTPKPPVAQQREVRMIVIVIAYGDESDHQVRREVSQILTARLSRRVPTVHPEEDYEQ